MARRARSIVIGVGLSQLLSGGLRAEPSSRIEAPFDLPQLGFGSSRIEAPFDLSQLGFGSSRVEAPFDLSQFGSSRIEAPFDLPQLGFGSASNGATALPQLNPQTAAGRAWNETQASLVWSPVERSSAQWLVLTEQQPAPSARVRRATPARGPRVEPAEAPGAPANLAIPALHATALMTVMRLSEAWIWPDPFAETRGSVIRDRYREAWTRPPKWDSERAAFEWDGDPWTINVLGHGLFGSQLYLRPRQCAQGPWASLLFATVASTVWDYGFEASGVRPSGVDLWYTPLAGALLGEARYAGWQIAESISSPTWRHLTRVLLDPLGEFERALGTSC